MKIVIAPDSFKGSADAAQVATAVKHGFSRIFPDAEYVLIPVADGGEGTCQAVLSCIGGTLHTAAVQNPLARNVSAEFALLNDGIAVLEIAAASGITLVRSGMQNPLKASTYGTGQLISSALDMGAKSIVLGLGGSATNDGGVGLARALGVRFLNCDGGEIEHICDISALKHIDVSKLDVRLKNVPITLATDVKNPLTGPTGATYVYGAQKGVKGDMFEVLDRNLAWLAQCISAQFGFNYECTAGIGAAGGAGLPLVAFCGATIIRGIDVVLDIANIDAHLSNASLVITGEGRMDAQSVYGKVPVGVAQRAKKYNLPVIAIVGGMGVGASSVYEYGVDAIFPIVNSPMPLRDAMSKVEALICETAERIARTIKLHV